MSPSGLILLVVAMLVLAVFAEADPDDDRPGRWAKAHGLWGKRSDKGSDLFIEEKRPVENWNKLNTLWGKRSADNYPMASYFPMGLKRASSWQQANGLWGRRK
ncbi:unnamed protein product, partial [Mesorhabditis spiculigera]